MGNYIRSLYLPFEGFRYSQSPNRTEKVKTLRGLIKKHWLDSKVIFSKKPDTVEILMTLNICLQLTAVPRRSLQLAHYFSQFM